MLLLLPFFFSPQKSLRTRSLAFGCCFCMLLTRGSMSCLSLVASLALHFFTDWLFMVLTWENNLETLVIIIEIVMFFALRGGGGNSGLGEYRLFKSVSCMCVTMWKSSCSLLVWVRLACSSWQPALGCVDRSLWMCVNSCASVCSACSFLLLSKGYLWIKHDWHSCCLCTLLPELYCSVFLFWAYILRKWNCIFVRVFNFY